MKRNFKEYNTRYHPLIKNTYVLMGYPFEHALQKATSYEEAISNLKILGWNDEWKKFIIDAVDYYAEHLKQNAPVYNNDDFIAITEDTAIANAVEVVEIKAFAEKLEKTILSQLTCSTSEKKEAYYFCLNEIENILEEMIGENKSI